MDSTIDLIVAPATAPQPAARSIVRLTGEGLLAVLSRLFVSADGSPLQLPDRHEAARNIEVRFHLDSLGARWGELPVSLLFWPGPAGPLGAAVAEVQLPGSAPLQAALVQEICRFGARLARGGEFSLRSFLAGKIDLLQAEAVVAVVDARTPQELSQALDRMAGGIGKKVEALREYLLNLVADIEAAIDFADDFTPDSVPVVNINEDAIGPKIHYVCQQLDHVAAQLAARDSGGQGGLPRVVLAGPPNIGKSSLFNRLVGRDIALVENEAGTTRDWIASELYDAGGIVTCVLVDLAGIGRLHKVSDSFPTECEVSVAADKVAREEIRRADVVVACHELETEYKAELEDFAAEYISVVTRIDQSYGGNASTGGRGCIHTSAVTGLGVEELRRRILDTVSTIHRETPATTRLRAGISEARESLFHAEKDLANCDGVPPDEALLAILLRQAIDALGEVTGAVVGTDILDRVFSRHCIGK